LVAEASAADEACRVRIPVTVNAEMASTIRTLKLRLNAGPGRDRAGGER